MSVSASGNFKLFNVPAILARDVEKPDPDMPGKWVRDDDWYRRTTATYRTLFLFLQKNELVTGEILGPTKTVGEIILHWDDLTAEGKDFVRTKAIEKWMNSLDDSRSKTSPEDATSLVRALSRFRGSR
jgi:hypothetical protein